MDFIPPKISENNVPLEDVSVGLFGLGKECANAYECERRRRKCLLPRRINSSHDRSIVLILIIFS